MSISFRAGLVFGRWPVGTILHSSNELGELSQWLCHNDSTINIVLKLLLLLLIIIRIICNYLRTDVNGLLVDFCLVLEQGKCIRGQLLRLTGTDQC